MFYINGRVPLGLIIILSFIYTRMIQELEQKTRMLKNALKRWKAFPWMHEMNCTNDI